MVRSGLSGERLGSYQLIEQVGSGGMATVYRAVDSRSGAERAVKILSPSIGSDEQFVRRFRREGRLLARLKHPNIVPVVDYGETGQVFYLVMPFIEGETLQRKLVHRRFSEAEIRRWIRQAAAALDFAHQRGVIHRDVKPSNILVDKDGNAYLTDFGLARLAESSGSLTGSLLLGTPAYVSPEQARSDGIDARTDQYSLGVILFQLVTGRLPFETDTPMATVMKHMREAPPQPRSLNPDLPPAAEKVILKCLAKNPGDRFPTVGEAARTFEAALDGATSDELGLDREPMAGSPTPISQWLRAAMRAQKPATLWVLAIVPVLVVAGVFLGGTLNGRNGSTGSSQERPVILPGLTSRVTPTPFLRWTSSTDCSWVTMYGAILRDNDVAWRINNRTGGVLTLFDTSATVVPLPGPVMILLGDEVVWEAEPGGEGQYWRPEADRSIDRGTAKSLTLRYEATPPATGYHLVLQFNNGCTIGGDW
ncbi:MAG: serine/threonine-protein kinase [Anaerolineales bacterium]